MDALVLRGTLDGRDAGGWFGDATMTIRRPKDLMSGCLFLCFGAAVLFVVRDYPFGTARNMGPGYFPWVLGALLAGLGLLLVGRALLDRRAEAIEHLALRPLLLVLGGTLLFALLLRPVGLVPAIVAAVLVGAVATPASRPFPALMLAALLAAGSALVFVGGLGQDLPLLGSWFKG